MERQHTVFLPVDETVDYVMVLEVVKSSTIKYHPHRGCEMHRFTALAQRDPHSYFYLWRAETYFCSPVRKIKAARKNDEQVGR
ncbi:hypothetical protein O9993_18250 [Vibrio lentus]|nr:hypothetical protein [Vibrio lentus]